MEAKKALAKTKKKTVCCCVRDCFDFKKASFPSTYGLGAKFCVFTYNGV